MPIAKELQFTFEEPPDDEKSPEADRFHALMLLSVWEETVEAQEQAAFWTREKEREKEVAKDKGQAKLKGAIRAVGLNARLQQHGRQPSTVSEHSYIAAHAEPTEAIF